MKNSKKSNKYSNNDTTGRTKSSPSVLVAFHTVDCDDDWKVVLLWREWTELKSFSLSMRWFIEVSCKIDDEGVGLFSRMQWPNLQSFQLGC